MSRPRLQVQPPGWRRLAALGVAGGLLMGIALPPPARAHDLWLEPETLFIGKRGQEIAVTMQVGERFHSEEEKSLRRKDVASFGLFFRPDRPPQDLLAGASEDQVPAGRFRMENGDEVLLVAERTPKFLEQDADHFNQYLAEENATAAITHRARLGQNDQPARERYTRYLKALVQSRDTTAIPAALHAHPVGQRLEILLETNPARLRAGEPLSVRVLFEGQPLAGASLNALHRPRPGQDAIRTLAAVTDAAGRASFPVDAPGAWMVRLVHLRPAPPGSPPGASEPQWESFWAAYVFGVILSPAADGSPTASAGGALIPSKTATPSLRGDLP